MAKFFRHFRYSGEIDIELFMSMAIFLIFWPFCHRWMSIMGNGETDNCITCQNLAIFGSHYLATNKWQKWRKIFRQAENFESEWR